MQTVVHGPQTHKWQQLNPGPKLPTFTPTLHHKIRHFKCSPCRHYWDKWNCFCMTAKSQKHQFLRRLIKNNVIHRLKQVETTDSKAIWSHSRFCYLNCSCTLHTLRESFRKKEKACLHNLSFQTCPHASHVTPWMTTMHTGQRLL